MAEVRALLRRKDTRLLTLTGAGGSGKTRLALQAAEAVLPHYSDRTHFVAFADITVPQLIAPTICQAVGLTEAADRSPIARLEDGFRHRSFLLVLDNLEQLVQGAAVLGELLGACQGLSLLVTSREPLHLTGEQQYDVPVMTEEDAAELFIARARSVSPSREIDSALASAICERLDRLPLAIELAAARTKGGVRRRRGWGCCRGGRAAVGAEGRRRRRPGVGARPGARRGGDRERPVCAGVWLTGRGGGADRVWVRGRCCARGRRQDVVA